jgi:uncharacterized cupredoxin-like copper-binding protein
MGIKSFRTVGFSLLIVFMLAVAACNGDDDNGDDGNGNGNGSSFTIETPGMTFDPDELTVSEGEEVEITLDNTDGQLHNFTLDEADFSIEAAGGESETGTFTAPDAGEYEFYCSVPGHREAGQVGTLTVE